MKRDNKTQQAEINKDIREDSYLRSGVITTLKGGITANKLLSKNVNGLNKIEVGMQSAKDLGNLGFQQTFKTSFTKTISSKTSWIVAAIFFAAETVKNSYRYFYTGEITGKEFALAITNSAITNAAMVPIGALGTAFGAGMLVAFGVTNPIGLVAAGFIGGILFCFGGSYAIDSIWEWFTNTKKDLSYPTPDEVYKASLQLYKCDETITKEKLDLKKKKDYLRTFHPDKVSEPSIKQSNTEMFSQYMNAYQIICERKKILI